MSDDNQQEPAPLIAGRKTFYVVLAMFFLPLLVLLTWSAGDLVRAIIFSVLLAGPIVFIYGLIAGIRTVQRQRREMPEQKANTFAFATIVLSLVGLSFDVVVGVVLWWLSWLSSTSGTDGLPFRRHGRALRASVVEHPGSNTAVTSDLSKEEQEWCADMWLEAARAEHASIPAFSRLAIELTALGAPLELVDRCNVAALQEADHTRRSFQMASRYSGRTYSAGRLPRSAGSTGRFGLMPRRYSVAQLAVRTLFDGCLGEAQAAALLAIDARNATDTEAHAHLSAIAADENQHGELAWAILAWCYASGGATAITFAAGRLPKTPGKAMQSSGREAELRSHGRWRNPSETAETYATVRESAIARCRQLKEHGG